MEAADALLDLEPAEYAATPKPRRKSSTSPTQRTLARLRKLGATAAVVEHWNPHARIRQDLFGGIDVVALMGFFTLGVQACTVGDQSKRIAKILAEPRVRSWLRAGNTLEVWGWGKHGARGRRKLWTLTRHAIAMDITGEPYSYKLKDL